MSEQKPKGRILIADSEYADTVVNLAERFNNFELVCLEESMKIQDLADNKFDGVITKFATIDKDFLGNLPVLKTVIKMGRNYYNIEADALRERKIAFGSSPRKGPNCVAELAITLILALSKDLLISHDSVSSGAYRLRGLRPERTSQRKMAFRWMENQRVHEVRGKTLGIVGMGEIGCELAVRASVMGMKNLYYKRTQLSSELEKCFNAEYRDLKTLLRESDYVCLAVPHTAETEKMIGENELSLMKPEAYIVNICRGGVIDEEALIAALSENRIAGAGLDVFTNEPLEAESPLCFLDNVIMVPHIGGGTGTNRDQELGDALEEMSRILSGESPTIDLS